MANAEHSLSATFHFRNKKTFQISSCVSGGTIDSLADRRTRTKNGSVDPLETLLFLKHRVRQTFQPRVISCQFHRNQHIQTAETEN